MFLVLYHGRQVEIASSLDFLWKQQAKKELEEMSEMRRHTNQLLQNILPLHVAKYFLEQDRRAEVIYCGTYFNVVTSKCRFPDKLEKVKKMSTAHFWHYITCLTNAECDRICWTP